MENDDVIVLGLDPGSSRTGWCRLRATQRSGRPRFAFAGSGIVPSTWEGFTFLMATPFDVGAVELVRGGAFASKGGGAIMKFLLLAAEAAGLAKGAVKSRGLDYVGMTALEWRKAVIGKPSATNKQISAVVPSMIRNFPARSNNHVRDAAGVAIAAASHLFRIER